MKNKDRISGGFFFLAGLGISIASIKAQLGTLQQPGPGFFAFLSGSIMAFLALTIFIYPGFTKDGSMGGREKKTSRWKNVLILGSTIAVYCFGVECLGYLLSTFIFLILTFRVIDPQSWWAAILGSAAITVCSYLLFQVWLGLYLPIGFWGF